MIQYKLYTKDDCAPCSSLKTRLALLGLFDYCIPCDTKDSVHRTALMDMGFRSVPVLVCIDTTLVDGLPFVINSMVGNEAPDGKLEDFFKGVYSD